MFSPIPGKLYKTYCHNEWLYSERDFAPLYPIPNGTHVLFLKKHLLWAKVVYKDQIGWIRFSLIKSEAAEDE